MAKEQIVQHAAVTVIFGVDSNNTLLPEVTRAWLRHAVRWWYKSMTSIDKHGESSRRPSRSYKRYTA